MPKPEIAIRVDTREIQAAVRRFKSIAQRQYPFAVARALTQTAKDASDAVGRQMGGSFKVRNRGIKRAVTFEAAKKRDTPPTAFVGTRPWADFLTLHAEGGVRKPKGAHRIAIPTRIVKRKSSGRVVQRFQPRTLRRRKGFQAEELEQERRIAVRGKRLRSKLGIYFLVRRRVKIRKRWKFREQVQKSAALTFPGRFKASLRKAIESAR